MGLGTFIFIAIIATLLGRAFFAPLRDAGPLIPLASGLIGAFAAGTFASLLANESAMDSVVHPVGPIAAAVGAVSMLLLVNALSTPKLVHH